MEYSRIHHLVKQTSFFVRAIEESMIRHASALIDIILLCQMLIDQLFKELGCLAKLQWSYWSDVATVERSFEQ
jgi:hypothetical protein